VKKRYQCEYCWNKFKDVKKFVCHLAEKHGVIKLALVLSIAFNQGDADAS